MKNSGSIHISDPIFQCVPLQDQCIFQSVFDCNFYVREITDTLSNLIWGEVICVSASMKCSNSYIKLAREKNDLDVLQLLGLIVSVFLQATNGNIPCDIHVSF